MSETLKTVLEELYFWLFKSSLDLAFLDLEHSLDLKCQLVLRYRFAWIYGTFSWRRTKCAKSSEHFTFICAIIFCIKVRDIQKQREDIFSLNRFQMSECLNVSTLNMGNNLIQSQSSLNIH